MKLLVKENYKGISNVIVACGNNLELKSDKAIIKTQQGSEYIYTSYNSSNSFVVEVEEDVLPNDFSEKKKYRYVNNEIIENYGYLVAVPFEMSAKETTVRLKYLPTEERNLVLESETAKLESMWRNIASKNSISDRFKLGLEKLHIVDGVSLGEDGLPIKLTEEEKEAQGYIKNELNKIKARLRIENEIGDVYDIIADLSKKVSMMNRLVSRFILAQLKGESLPEPYATEYLAFLEQYITGVDGEVIKDRGDLEDNSEMFYKISTRETLMVQILKEEYFDKKI